MTGETNQIGRRNWLLRALIGAVTLTGGILGYPVAMFLRPRRTSGSTGVEMVAPYRVDQLVLDSEGQWPPPFDFGGRPCLLLKTPDGSVRAFNAVCTHLECTVTYRPDKNDMFCNCHNGVFSADGAAVSGPPPRPLEEYEVTLTGQPGKEEIIVSRG